MDRSLSASTMAAPVRASTTSKVSTAVRVVCGSAPPTTVLILAPTTFNESESRDATMRFNNRGRSGTLTDNVVVVLLSRSVFFSEARTSRSI